MTRHFLAILLTHLVLTATSQKMTVITLDNSKIEIIIISDSAKHKLLQDFDGKQDNTIRKQWTARTYRLSDDRLLIEFYDRQAAIINNAIDFDKLKEIRFIKTYIDFLKKNISYKIELNYDKGKEIVKQFNLKQIDKFKSELLDFTSIEVYELINGQILFINTTNNSKSAAIYENIKALASECNDVQNQFYGDLETSSEKFINGDPLLDYENDGQWVYPKDEKKVIQNHKLKLVESKVFVETFYGNLYKSENGYYVLINEVNQKNGGGNKMGILTARVYESLDQVREAQTKYKKRKNEDVKSEHFYQKISDKYGKDFPLFTKQLIDTLPLILNFDKEQLTFDSIGMAIVDEAIHWNHSNYALFDNWYPSVLAYYGQCYMTEKKEGNWVVKKDKEYNVLIPHLVLSDGEDAFDMRDFYKDLYEWPISIKWAGDWDGHRRQMRKHFETQNSRRRFGNMAG